MPLVYVKDHRETVLDSWEDDDGLTPDERDGLEPLEDFDDTHAKRKENSHTRSLFPGVVNSCPPVGSDFSLIIVPVMILSILHFYAK